MISSEVPYSAHDSSSPRSRGRECGRRLQQLQTANDRRVKRIDRSKKHLGTTTRGPNLVLLSLDFDKNNTCAVFVDIRYVHICTYLCVCVCVCVYPFFYPNIQAHTLFGSMKLGLPLQKLWHILTPCLSSKHSGVHPLPPSLPNASKGNL